MNVLTQATIRALAAELGFSAAYLLPPAPIDGAPDGCHTLILLAWAYQPGGWLIDRYYLASNRAYHQSKALAQRLIQRGERVFDLSGARLKGICRRLPHFSQGRNTLNYLPRVGSRFAMELLGCSFKTEECTDVSDQSINKTDQDKITDSTPDFKTDQSINITGQSINPCGTCEACVRACPTGAIINEGFDMTRCIRFHMLRNTAMPLAFRAHIGVPGGSKGIIGCDVCQSVCPLNHEVQKTARCDDDFTLEELLRCDKATMARFAAACGANCAGRARIMAQAALTAGNTGDKRYLPALRELAKSDLDAVAEHAAWAMEHLDKQ